MLWTKWRWENWIKQLLGRSQSVIVKLVLWKEEDDGWRNKSILSVEMRLECLTFHNVCGLQSICYYYFILEYVFEFLCTHFIHTSLLV